LDASTIVSKAETFAEAAQTVSTEVLACVIGDASLHDFSAELPGFTQALRGQSIPLIIIHHGDDSPLIDSIGPGVATWLTRATINVNSVDLAISKAIELADMSRKIEGLEQELQSTKEKLRSAMAAAAAASENAREIAVSVDKVKQPAPQPESSMDQLAESSAAPTLLERPALATSDLKVSSDDERELAARVQHDLMPPGSPLIQGFDIAGLSIHAEVTGGDYYDYLPMADDLLCISIGECSGRGLAPAMFMASLRAYLRVLATQTTDISDVLSQVNTLITEDIGDEEFIITLMLFQLDDRTRTLRYASAGHQAFFLDREGNVDVLHSTGMPLGLRDETVILEGPSRKIRTGEILLLASDGVQKMTSESGEYFGTDRMLKLVNENRNLPSRIIANYLRKACTEFASPQFQHDDVTIVIVKGDDS
jgi:serine phosphatase RsbU (regulator of sigma subunit)